MLVASGKWTNPSVSSDICGVAGQDGGGVSGGESCGDVGGDVGGASRSFGAGDQSGRSAVSCAALYTVARTEWVDPSLLKTGQNILRCHDLRVCIAENPHKYWNIQTVTGL